MLLIGTLMTGYDFSGVLAFRIVINAAGMSYICTGGGGARSRYARDS